MKRIVAYLLIGLALIVASSAVAQGNSDADYARMAAKAQRFFDNEEWPNAHAMYLLMLDQRPRVASTYGRDIVANMMDGDTVAALDMVPRALSHGIAIDTIFTEVQRTGYSLGRGELYEHFLLDVKARYTWFGRVVDNYLMRYYSERNNGPELIRYAQIMLAGLPDDVGFRRMLARGYMLDGHTDQAVQTWLGIAADHPDNYPTLLDLGNYYIATDQPSEALPWLRRAYAIKATPYVGGLIDKYGK